MEPGEPLTGVHRSLKLIWLAMLSGVVVQVLVIFLLLSRMFSHPMGPPADIFSRGMKLGFVIFIIGFWVGGYLMARSARNKVYRPGSPTGRPLQWSVTPERLQRMMSLAIASWAFFEAGILISLVYWMITREWATILPPMVLHAGALLYFGPGYFLPPSPDRVAP